MVVPTLQMNNASQIDDDNSTAFSLKYIGDKQLKKFVKAKDMTEIYVTWK